MLVVVIVLRLRLVVLLLPLHVLQDTVYQTVGLDSQSVLIVLLDQLLQLQFLPLLVLRQLHYSLFDIVVEDLHLLLIVLVFIELTHQ